MISSTKEFITRKVDSKEEVTNSRSFVSDDYEFAEAFLKSIRKDASQDD